MGEVLNYIAEKTYAKCYKSYKYCYDSVANPNLLYDSSDDYINLKQFAETIKDPEIRDMRPICNSITEPLFKYFLDGSRRVYKVDDISMNANGKVYPVIAGQVVVSCCERITDKKGNFLNFRNAKLEDYTVLSLPMDLKSGGKSFFSDLCNDVNADCKNLKRRNIKIEKILPYSTNVKIDESMEKKGIAVVQDEMVECEKRIVSELMASKKLNQNCYLIKDGTIQYKVQSLDKNERIKMSNNYRHVVGVSKSFNPEIAKDKKDKSIAERIAKLPMFHRTPAYMYESNEQLGNAQFAIWYVRVRENKYTETPFSGILKLEKLLITDSEKEDGLESEQIDTISANIINERNPVCYGNDQRWANHLYPVYLTEQHCKSKFIGEQFFINLF